MGVYHVQFLSLCSQGVLKFDGSVMMQGTIIVDVFYRLYPVNIILISVGYLTVSAHWCSHLLSLMFSETVHS